MQQNTDLELVLGRTSDTVPIMMMMMMKMMMHNDDTDRFVRSSPGRPAGRTRDDRCLSETPLRSIIATPRLRLGGGFCFRGLRFGPGFRAFVRGSFPGIPSRPHTSN